MIGTKGPSQLACGIALRITLDAAKIDAHEKPFIFGEFLRATAERIDEALGELRTKVDELEAELRKFDGITTPWGAPIGHELPIKPEPREWWMVVGIGAPEGLLYQCADSSAEAQKWAEGCQNPLKIVHVREVV